MAAWRLISSFNLNGKATYEVFSFETKDECIQQARKKWKEFWSLSNDPAYKKKLLTRAVNKFNHERLEIKFDSAGFMTIK